MKTRRCHALVLSCAFVVLASVNAHAVSFDFSSSSQFTNNFTTYNPDTGTPGYSASTGAVTWVSGGGQTGNFVYDSNGVTAGVDTFADIVVEFDFSMNVNNASVGVYFGGSRTSGNLALLNLNRSSDTDTLRFFSGSNLTASSSSSAGTVITTGISSPTGSISSGFVNFNAGWTTNTTYHATLTISYTGATTANITYTISDPYASSTPLTSISATATGIAVATAGEIGFRTGLPGAGTVTIDNVQISSPIPEPSTFALLGGLGALGFALSIRRR